MATQCKLSICQELVQEVWQEQLKVEEVSPIDDFFDLGGHSLVALMINGRIGYLLNVEVPLRTIFDNPVLADYSAAVYHLLPAANDAAA